MTTIKTLTAALAIASVASASFAGGLSDQIMEAPVVVEEEIAVAGPSIDPALIVLGILGLLVIGASSGDSAERTPVPDFPVCDPNLQDCLPSLPPT